VLDLTETQVLAVVAAADAVLGLVLRRAVYAPDNVVVHEMTIPNTTEDLED